ncbi:hypothetical protein M409DRAFT_27465 [Zasmidium cellare ATCC 36951]|uniref:Uncharacterized protein n=1 Tax=Zasmidium cellare ATCC 36951 TaxID=1080233 RepID=A0A6A6C755_ZASCE|nr:uncharacterized protein M409DRAFT_27465 [Zasmidium cellare ATCC 36951]KAF2162088.1 hypothetical protein M409DRAFT_27465 [Zasmidium cellare ATCC 36951]
MPRPGDRHARGVGAIYDSLHATELGLCTDRVSYWVWHEEMLRQTFFGRLAMKGNLWRLLNAGRIVTVGY